MLEEAEHQILLLWLGRMNVSPITQARPSKQLENIKRRGGELLTCARLNLAGVHVPVRTAVGRKCVFTAAADALSFPPPRCGARA